MATAIWWLNKKSEAREKALKEEQDARLSDLEKRSDLCEEDRNKLREKFYELLSSLRKP